MSTQTTEETSESATDIEKQRPLEQELPSQTAEIEGKDPNVVGWDGDNDPEYPLNWSNEKKWLNGGLLAAMTFVT